MCKASMTYWLYKMRKISDSDTYSIGVQPLNCAPVPQGYVSGQEKRNL